MEDENNNKKTQRNSHFPGMFRGFAAPVTLALFAVPMVLLAGLIAMGFWAADRHREAEELRAVNENVCREAYTELAGSVRELNAELSKLVLSEAPSTLALSLDGVWRESGAITALLGRIPSAHAENAALNRLIVQTGDYCRSLSSSVLGGKPLTENDRKQILSLVDASEKICTELENRLAGGNIPLTALDAERFYAEPAGENAEYPKLDYNGPYSDSAENRQALGVSGDELSEDEVKTKAKELVALALGDEGAAEQITAQSLARVEAGYPRYDLALVLPDGRTADIALAAQGGQLVYFRLYGARETAPAEQDLGTLKTKGLEFLRALGYEHAEPTYHSTYDGSVVVSCCCTQGLGHALADGEEEPSVIMMNDAVRLRFDTATGDIIGADASKCLMNHTERSFADVTAAEQAQANLSPYLSVSSSRLALIPMDDFSEKLCWEFRGSFRENEYLVYMDATTGEEVRIVRIISDENGTSEA